MKEIKCPECGKVFTIDEAGYAQIVDQVRNEEFNAELERRLHEQEEKKASEIESAVSKKETEMTRAMAKKDKENAGAIADKDTEIAELKAQLESAKKDQELAVTNAVSGKELELKDKEAEMNQAITDKDAEIAKLKAQLDSAKKDQELAVTNAVSGKELELKDKEAEMRQAITDKDTEIADLKSQLKSAKKDQELAVQKAVSEKDIELQKKDGEISKLNSDLETKDKDKEISEQRIKDNYEEKIKDLDDQIERLRDMKVKLSTKMVGETLEQHCQIQFEQLRHTAFPNAYFEKDNEVVGGTKADFIFRDYDGDTEYISIAFEMKNESDTTASKHKNEDFFKKLDEDRKKKGCEYAILVSLLEQENELYNAGIVDVSHKYEKMYVIRPQFFIPMLTLLTNAARNSLSYQHQLEIIKNQEKDFSQFEANIEAFKTGFTTSFTHAKDRFEDAIEGIDKAIGELQKIKDNLTKSQKHLTTSNNKLEDLTVKKLTKNAPSVRAKLEEIADENPAEA